MGRATNKDCTSEVLKRCIELAYSDMMTAGRYYSASFLNNKDEICLATNRAIIESNFVFSRKIIEDISLLFCDNTIGNDNHYVTGFGLAQKLINMTFKYLYVFSDLIFIDKPIPNFSSCDCPLDSIIIKKAHINDCVWSKLTEQQYRSVIREYHVHRSMTIWNFGCSGIYLHEQFFYSVIDLNKRILSGICIVTIFK